MEYNEFEIKDMLEEAKFYIVSQKYEEAEKILKQILEKEPENIEALYNLGILYEIINDRDRAREFFKKVVDKQPSNKDAEEHLNKLSEY